MLRSVVYDFEFFSVHWNLYNDQAYSHPRGYSPLSIMETEFRFQGPLEISRILRQYVIMGVRGEPSNHAKSHEIDLMSSPVQVVTARYIYESF